MIPRIISSLLAPPYHYVRQVGIHVNSWEPLLKDFSQASSIALIGNAGYLSSLNQGDSIDEHEIVIRMNNFALAGHEKSVGKKTDAYLTNFYHDIDFSNPHARQSRWIISSVPNNFIKIKKPPISQRHGAHITTGMQRLNRNEVFAPSFSTYKNHFLRLSRYPSTGSIGLLFILEILATSKAKIFISGFSFMQGKNHYFSNSKPDTTTHDPERERRWASDAMAQHILSGQITLDPLMADLIFHKLD